MTFDEVLAQVLELLQRQGRVSYGALKRRFGLDDAYLDDLKAELIEAQRVAGDESGRILVWIGATDAPPGLASAPLPGPSDQERLAFPAAAAPGVLPAPEAERRQLTVLVCDLVGSTPLASQLDPEDLLAVIHAYQTACTTVIARFGGHVAQHLGDGLLVYFGYPQAHDDDAQRAVRAGLGIVEALGPLNERLAQTPGVQLALRVGIHTGLVVVGAMGEFGRQEQLALGDTPLLAARLQSLAAPNTVVLSATTARLVHDAFAWQPLTAQLFIPGAQPLAVYRALGERDLSRDRDIVPSRVLTPLVGREQEVSLLRERWLLARDGMGQVVLVSGEAGIGKSRLVQVLQEQVVEMPHVRWECRGSPYHQHTAFYPLIDLWERILRWQSDESPEAKLTKLEDALAQYHLPLGETVPLLAALLSLPVSAERYPPLALTPQRQKQCTLELLLACILERAAQRPVLLIVEDLHWVDPSTLEFLALLIDQGPTAAVCAVLTCRPEFQPPWGLRTHLTPIALHRLLPDQARLLVAQVTGRKPLPPEVTEQVVNRTDGVPLFVEELTKTVLETGLLREEAESYELSGPLPPLAIPPTLHDALMARLDRLAAVKVVAQLGAVLGRTFAYPLVQAVAALDEATLQQSLHQLVEAELLYQRGVPPGASYRFKHALIQEAAYQSLLKSTRQQYHQRIARVLAGQFPEIAASQPEVLAHHYTAAECYAEAIPYWHSAGQQAVERSAHLEAIAHFSHGLELLQHLPDSAERWQQELTLQLVLGVPLMATKGYGAPEVAQAYTRAQALCQQIEGNSGVTPPMLFPALHGLYRFYIVRGDFRMARALGEQLLALAQSVQDPALLLEAHMALAITLFWLGELAAAHTHAERGISLYQVSQHRTHAFLYGQDPGAVCHCYAAWALWHLGYPQQGLQRLQQALTLAQELSHPYTLGFILSHAAIQYQHRQEAQGTWQQAEAAITLSTEQGFLFWLAWGKILQGWSLAETGHSAEGILQMRQNLTTWQAIGAEIALPYALTLLAAVYGKNGQFAEGLATLEEALTVSHRTGEQFYEAELYRLRGELLWQADIRGLVLGGSTSAIGAEACLQQALSIARHQHAKSLELRAAMSLGKLWQQQGKQESARALLTEVYDWFTEGLDTADLQEARAFLATL